MLESDRLHESTVNRFAIQPETVLGWVCPTAVTVTIVTMHITLEVG